MIRPSCSTRWRRRVSRLRIGLAHGSIRDFSSRGEAQNQIAPDRAQRSNLDYLALGDWHGTLRVDARTWYSGTPETDRFQRDEPGHALLVTLEPGIEAAVKRRSAPAGSSG